MCKLYYVSNYIEMAVSTKQEGLSCASDEKHKNCNVGRGVGFATDPSTTSSCG